MSAAVARAFALVEALAGHTVDGRRLKHVAEVTRQSGSTTLRDLQVLEGLGIAQRIPGRDDCWRLAPRIVQISHAHHNELARLQTRLDEIAQRYTTSPN